MERYKIAAQLNACLGNAGWWDERPTHLLLASRTICDWPKRVHTLRVHGSIALCSQLGSAAEKLTDGGVLYMWSSRRALSLQQRQFFGCARSLSSNESCKKFCTLTLVMVRSRAAVSIQQWESCRLYPFALHELFAFSRALSLFVRHAAEALHMHSQSLTACNANVLSPKIFAKSAIALKHTNKAMRVCVCVCVGWFSSSGSSNRLAQHETRKQSKTWIGFNVLRSYRLSLLSKYVYHLSSYYHW